FRHAPAVISNPRILTKYPELVNKIALQLFMSTGTPKPKLVNALLRTLVHEVSLPHLLLDGLQAVRGL
ncbi:MAG: hypothetical protein Q6361_02735, partial [Candidatus Hermodarchaeota archaeon]|nr:hypothetical protein [Candidatus Hermodarchaeota archaeon]